MKKNIIRIIVATLLGITFFTALLILLKKSPLIYSAYIWCVWALIVFAVGMGYWACSRKSNYILHAAYPLLLKSYLSVSILTAVIFAGISYAKIWTIPWGWFCLIEFAAFAIIAWKVQALNTGEDAITAVDEQVKVSTVSWKMLVADITAIAERTSGADRKQVNRVMESIRFADPVEHAAVSSIVESINVKISALGEAVDSKDSGKIQEICIIIERLVKERSTKLMIVKQD